MHDVYANMSEFDRIKNLNKKEAFHLDDLQSIHLQEKRSQSGRETSSLQRTEQAAVMAVPGHDERDFDFAKTYDLPIKRVLIENENDDPNETLESAFTDDGYMVPSGMDGFDGQFGDAALPLSSMLSKRLEGRPSSQLEDSPMAHQSSTILGYSRFQSFTVKIVGLFRSRRSTPC